MYHIPELSNKLALLAEEALPKFSGQNKVLEVIVRFHYDKCADPLPFGVTSSQHQHIKVLFWHPNNAMLVGYNFETMVENIFDNYIVSANHSSTWKSEGLNFFDKILTEPKSWTIIKSEILKISNPRIDSYNEFTFELAGVQDLH